MEIRFVPVNQMNPAPYNPRKDLEPGSPDYEKIKKSLIEFDYVDPIIWNERTGNIVGGHQRFKILVNDLGRTRLGVSVVNLSPSREKALNIALNKTGGEWDMPKLKDLLIELDTGEFDIEITGFDEDEIAKLMYVPNFEAMEEPEKAEPDVTKSKIIECPHCHEEFEIK